MVEPNVHFDDFYQALSMDNRLNGNGQNKESGMS